MTANTPTNNLHTDSPYETRQILGIKFFAGSAEAAVDRMIEHSGLLVVPAAPALKDLPTHEDYREALLNADLVIMDSALMVLVWNYMRKDKVKRVSGLEYLKLFLEKPGIKEDKRILWIMAGEESSAKNLSWLKSRGITVAPEFVYLAPLYQKTVSDEELVAHIEMLRPQHIVVTVGGGTQERLGLYLKRTLSYRAGIHCIGAAIAFLSGDQVRIPMWADKLYLGWLLRCLSQPKRYVPRYWAARALVSLMLRHGSELPIEG